MSGWVEYGFFSQVEYDAIIAEAERAWASMSDFLREDYDDFEDFADGYVHDIAYSEV